jgi:hypothetical protein
MSFGKVLGVLGGVAALGTGVFRMDLCHIVEGRCGSGVANDRRD